MRALNDGGLLYPSTCYDFVFFFSIRHSLVGIQEFPENIKNCKVLAIVEASVNPISK